ncbi:RodZ domain-containing protein [uncultured Pseudodesulfovibrio sp.]|uniref:helix-turn-helix domain-containing protein n=1 Tax=uncultured Pseudodesulfovibrio sp. TaxID=2035858 RepID=UPI0029C6E3F7|nr:RodZ domain-containing protein [uncultured Pseudodesulfovibrio sp.]
MNFEELGLTLKREREKKGLSIELVMEATKISRTNIVAMEEGDRSSLPHAVYAKGFVKSYARYLGLDADELSMTVDREFVDETDEQEETAYDVSPAAEKAFQGPDVVETKTRSVLPMLLVAVLLIVVVVLLLMNLNAFESEKATAPASAVETVVPDTETPAPAIEQESVAQEPVVEDVATSAAETANESEVATENVDAAAAPEVPVETVVETPKPAVPEKKVEAPVEKPVVAAKPEKQKYDHVLIIRATTDKGCWIGVWRGDETKMARDFVLKQGEPLRLMFNSPRRIRIGNVAGVTVTYNGKPYSLNGATGNIQTLRFGTE